MFRGGFGSYTKTGRSIALGRACGESWARQSNRNSNRDSDSDSDTNKEDDTNKEGDAKKEGNPNKEDDVSTWTGFIIISLLAIIFYMIVQPKLMLKQ